MRPVLSALTLVLAALSVCACDPYGTDRKRAQMTEEDAQLAHKFRRISGGELFVDSIPQVYGVNIIKENGDYFYARSSLNPRNNSRHAYNSHFGMPKYLRIIWRDGYVPQHRDLSIPSWMFLGGNVLGDYTVPVASRIPIEVLDAVRAGRGELRLKIRIHSDGPLIGWDVLNMWAGETELAGGAFREAKIRDGVVIRKGWYIHPKTKEKIETDF